jgi:hypothetical protein
MPDGRHRIAHDRPVRCCRQQRNEVAPIARAVSGCVVDGCVVRQRRDEPSDLVHRLAQEIDKLELAAERRKLLREMPPPRIPLEWGADQDHPLEVGHQRARRKHRVAKRHPIGRAGDIGRKEARERRRVDAAEHHRHRRPQLPAHVQENLERSRALCDDNADRLVAIFLLQIGPQMLDVWWAVESAQIEHLRVDGQRRCRAYFQGGQKGRPEIQAPWRIRLGLIEDQHRARQRLRCGGTRKRGGHRQHHDRSPPPTHSAPWHQVSEKP